MRPQILFILSSLLLLCLADIQYCDSGLQNTPSAFNDIISDHTGGDAYYLPDMDCFWLVDGTLYPEIVGYVINFTRLDLEYLWDTVSFYYNPDTSQAPFAYFTGNVIPEDPFFVDSVTFYVIFHSDSVVVGKGFSFEYTAVTNDCADPTCGGHGRCEVKACICDEGYNGPNCTERYCPAGCSGTCTSSPSGSYCECPVGVYGADCNSKYCSSKTVTYNTDYGTFGDKSLDQTGTYLPSQTCSWLLQPETHGVIVISIEEFVLEDNWDFVYIYDGKNETDSNLVAAWTGKMADIAVPFVEIFSGSAFIVFKSDWSIQRSGFTLNWLVVECQGCNENNGYCSATSECICNPGWAGATCETPFCTDCSGSGTCINGTQCDCLPDYSGLDCGICNSVNCPQTYCDSNVVTLSNSTATFADHTGAGDYRQNTSCTWLIDPVVNYDSIGISFSRFDLAPNSQTRIQIVDYNSNDLIASYKGSSNPTILFVTGPVIVTFLSDGSPPRSGFIANYETYTCLNSCGDNGICRAGVCLCDTGYNGTDCSSLVCDEGCNGNGECVPVDDPVNGNLGETCVCDNNWYGPGCDDEYCNGQNFYTTPEGVFASHTVEGPYQPNSDCDFIFSISNETQPVTVYFNFMDLDLTAAVRIFDDIYQQSLLAQYFRSYYAPSPVLLSTGSGTVSFVSGSGYPHLGFSGGYVSNNLCPNSCSNLGFCMPSHKCLCPGGYAGADCSGLVTDFDIPALQPFVTSQANLSSFEWQYYVIQLTEDIGGFDVTVSRTSPNGQLELYLGINLVPDDQSYDAFSADSNFIAKNILGLRDPGQGTYYIAVHALWGAEYSITLNYYCPICSNGGVCSSAYSCDCPPPYTGSRCETDGQSTSGTTTGTVISTGVVSTGTVTTGPFTTGPAVTSGTTASSIGDSSTSPNNNKKKGGVIAGIVIGVLLGIGLIALLLWFIIKRVSRKNQQQRLEETDAEIEKF